MTSLLEGAKKLVARGTDLGARIAGLDEAVDAARGRLDDALVDAAPRRSSTRAGDRLRLSADHTVVAIAGATGSGKSSTFNSLTGLEISAVGVRRPTTSWTTACVWGSEGADRAARVARHPAAAPRHPRLHARHRARGQRRCEGVVLLDLPDHDSTEVSHHLEVDRLVQLADLLVWVLDPQKYADAAIHDRYLAPWHAPGRDAGRAQPHRHRPRGPRATRWSPTYAACSPLDGLGEVPVLAISAREGIGIDTAAQPRSCKRVADKKSARTRLEADLRAAAQRLEQQSGTAAPGAARPRSGSPRSTTRFADAAGVPTVVAAVREVDPDARPAGHRMARGRLALQAPARPAQAAPPRPRLGRQGAERPRPDLGARGHPGPAGPGRRRGAGAWPTTSPRR